VVWVRGLEVHDLRNIREARLELGVGLNVFRGRNAQGKTTLLEAVGLLARGRSFRTEDTASLIRWGTAGSRARGVAVGEGRDAQLEVELEPKARRLRVDGQEVPPRAYQGRLEVVVYSTDRLRVVRGSMRERRQYLDRGGSALWPAYRQAGRDYERVMLQRNAALEAGSRDLPAWNERFLELGARLRTRRRAYVERLQAALGTGFRPRAEVYGIELLPDDRAPGEEEQRAALAREIQEWLPQERRARRSLVGPHRDRVRLTVDGEEAGATASSGQARSLLLALTLATLAVYRAETGRSAVALLDDLDSELDEERASLLCQEVAARGQALVTTAHAGWAEGLGAWGRLFEVAEGEVRSA
jgi:DNA replication and repair protein RecF